MTGDSRHQITKMVENMENMQIIKEISQTSRKHAPVHMLFNTRLVGCLMFCGSFLRDAVDSTCTCIFISKASRTN